MTTIRMSSLLYPKDAELLLSIARESGIFKPEDTIWDAKHIIVKQEVIFLFESNNIGGFVTYVRHGNLRHGLMELVHIGVSPRYQKRGFATLLMRELEREAGNFFQRQNYSLKRVFLFTKASNTPAQHLYMQCGFKKSTSIQQGIFTRDIVEELWIKDYNI
jgi:ribosomal protein S18 acetylase RimI-like enzyme